jgi:PAS domain S-box-containing protein
MTGQSADRLRVLVADGSPEFTAAVTEALEAADRDVAARGVTAREELFERVRRDEAGVDGVVVGDRLSAPVAAVERLADGAGHPVVFLADAGDGGDGGERVAAALAAGATDCFPRATTAAQYELVASSLASSRTADAAGDDPDGPATGGGEAGGPVGVDGPVRELFESVTDGLAVRDPDTGEILDANGRLCSMHGYDRGELVGEPFDRLASTGSGDGRLPALDRVETGGDGAAGPFERRHRRADGESFPVELRHAVVDLGGERQVLTSVREITERRRREREYEQIFHGVTDGIGVHDPETGEILDANDTYLDIVGYDDVGTVRDLGIGGLSATEEGYTAERGRAVITGVAASGDPETVEWRVERRDGERRWLEATVAPATVGGERRVLSINRDVTEQRRREREYEQIFEMAGDGIVVHDPETGAVVDVNRQVADLLGYDRSAFLDRPLSAFQATDEGVSGREARERIRESVREGGQQFEWPLEAADGGTVWVRARHEIGEIGGERRVVALLHDITERKRREREYEQIFNGVNDAISIHDPDTGEYLDVNDALCDLLGYDREEVLELGLDGLSATEEGYTPEQAREFIGRVVETGESATVEWKVETSDGERRLLDAKGTVLEIDGELRYVAIGRDVTERKEREQRLEVFNRVLRHDLRNRLDVVKSHAEALAAGVEGPHAERIIDSADRLAAVGNRARDIDRLLSRELTPSRVDLAAAVADRVDSLVPPDGDVSIALDAPDRAPVVTDAEVFGTALESALDNAVDHAESSVAVSVEAAADGYAVAVADDGPGIAVSELAPLDAGTETDLQHGRGLGLWQLEWGVEKLNGTLSFDTDGGTTVRMTVPDLGADAG